MYDQLRQENKQKHISKQEENGNFPQVLIGLNTKEMQFQKISCSAYRRGRQLFFVERQWHKAVRLKHYDIKDVDLSTIGLDRIRNFSIIAHIDHGKSTLADRMLEFVGAIDRDKKTDRVLDKLKVEKERGITVKAQTASLLYESSIDGQTYLINLIDTPGHVDFSSEVSRSISACQGVVLLVDANQGVQAQTVSNFYMAFANDLVIIPVLNKIDLPNANPEAVKEQLLNLFDIDPSQVLMASAKAGIGTEDIFEAIIERIPPPNRHGQLSKLRCFLQDSWYDKYRGAVNLVQVIDGVLKTNDVITSSSTGQAYTIRTLGLLTPEEQPIKSVYPGQVAVFTCNMRSTRDAIIGDTFHLKDSPVEPLMTVNRPKPMVFAGIYPLEQSSLKDLKNALDKVCLNDYSVTMTTESSAALGTGYRIGFLGVLHMEVFTQRLEDEYNASVIVTPPSVPYRIKLRSDSNKNSEADDIVVSNPNEWPKESCEAFFEPMVRGTIIIPEDYLTATTTICTEARGTQTAVEYIDQYRVRLEFLFPLAEILTKFFDNLKSVTSGYGSFDYEDAGYEKTSLVKVDILINDEMVPELSTIAHVSRARQHGKMLVAKLEETITRQQFPIKIQAAAKSKILARGNIKPVRKDVTAKCYGGDLQRKMKLLKFQAEGKKRMRMVGKVQLSQDVFRKLLS